MLDKNIFATHFTLMCEIYDREPTRALIEAYYFVLQDMSNEEFKSSVLRVLKERKFATLPKPAEILAYNALNIETIATIAIDDIEHSIAKYGAYSSISFEDVVINSIIDHLGGWINVCKMSTVDWNFAKKQIPKLYEIYGRRVTHPKHLIGISENVNGYAKKVEYIAAGYQIKQREVVPALNPVNVVVQNLLSAMSR